LDWIDGSGKLYDRYGGKGVAGGGVNNTDPTFGGMEYENSWNQRPVTTTLPTGNSGGTEINTPGADGSSWIYG